jgi:hypothetical protein
VLALAVSVLLAFAAPPAAGSFKPVLAVAKTAPLTVRGSHFRAGERVTVEASMKRRYVRTVTASASGAFLVRFAGVALDGCTSYLLRATGSRGSVAVRKVVPMCPPLQPIEP